MDDVEGFDAVLCYIYIIIGTHELVHQHEQLRIILHNQQIRVVILWQFVEVEDGIDLRLRLFLFNEWML